MEIRGGAPGVGDSWMDSQGARPITGDGMAKGCQILFVSAAVQRPTPTDPPSGILLGAKGDELPDRLALLPAVGRAAGGRPTAGG